MLALSSSLLCTAVLVLPAIAVVQIPADSSTQPASRTSAPALQLADDKTQAGRSTSAAARPATEVLLQNEQIDVELTRYENSCTEVQTGKPDSDTASCVEMTITNLSPKHLTAWVATAETEFPNGRRSVQNIRDVDTVLQEREQEILPRDTHRFILGNQSKIEFKAAIFDDGSMAGDPAWADRIVQNRRRTYQSIAVSLQNFGPRIALEYLSKN